MKPQTEVKILGVYLDNKLNFNNHINTLHHKAGRQVNVIARLSQILSKENKILLYNSFVECHLSYSSCLWHFCSKENTYKLEKLQKMALKFITLCFNCSYYERCKKYSLYIVRLHKIMEMCYKIKNGLYPEYLDDLITDKTVDYNIR